MPKIAYQSGFIRPLGQRMIRYVNEIVEAYNVMGYQLTLRQVYYQLVARDIIPNSDKSYHNLGELVSKGRLLGLIDWYAIEDRTRFVRKLSHWNEPSEIVHSAVNSYRIDLWEDQPQYVEVWVEKDALIGIVQQVANKFDVPCFSCRGYTSQTEMWNAAKRLQEKSYEGERPVKIIHLGDHDPSGIDMTRDIFDRIDMFMAGGFGEEPIHVDFAINRIALNMDQIKKYKPPPNPAKVTDARFDKYVKKFGNTCWELDAIEPDKLDALIGSTIVDYMDKEKMKQRQAQMEEQREQLKDAVEFVAYPDRWSRTGKQGYYFGE